MVFLLFILIISTTLYGASPCWQEQWTGTWATSPIEGSPGLLGSNVAEVNNQTIRQTAHISIGGDVVRVKFSNEFGTAPLVIGSARIAISGDGGSIQPGSDRALTFGGQTSIVIPPGAPALSDPVSLTLPPLSDVSVSIYLPTLTPTMTFHFSAVHTAYISTPGDFTAAIDLPVETTSENYFFLSGISVLTSPKAAAIVTFGDSITDGLGSTVDLNNEWPSILAVRLQENENTDHLGVLNSGISGNRVLRNNIGQNALSRFDRDVLAQPGVKYLVVMIGINDIGFSGGFFGIDPEPVTAGEIIAGLSQIVARARENGLKVYGATLTPFGGVGAPYETPEGEAMRQEINEWIRSSGEYDSVIDFDLVLRDPADPTVILAEYDSGDHLHPGDAGYAAMANAINLKLFKR